MAYTLRENLRYSLEPPPSPLHGTNPSSTRLYNQRSIQHAPNAKCSYPLIHAKRFKRTNSLTLSKLNSSSAPSSRLT